MNVLVAGAGAAVDPARIAATLTTVGITGLTTCSGTPGLLPQEPWPGSPLPQGRIQVWLC